MEAFQISDNEGFSIFEDYSGQYELSYGLATPEPEPQQHFDQELLINNEQYFEGAAQPEWQYSSYQFEEAGPDPYQSTGNYQWVPPSPPADALPTDPIEWILNQPSASVEQPVELSMEEPVEQLAKRGPGRPRKHPLKDPDAPKRSAGRPKGQGDSYKRLAKGEKAGLSKEERKKEVARRKLKRIAESTQPTAHYPQPYPSPSPESSSSFCFGMSSGCGLPS